MTYTLCILGCGTMGKAIISGVIESLRNPDLSVIPGTPPDAVNQNSSSSSLETLNSTPSTFIACVSRPESVKKLNKTCQESGWSDVIVRSGRNVESVKESDVILLGCKPQLAKDVLGESGMKEALKDKLVISILAGTTLTQLRSLLPESTTVVRAMPNTPCRIREGMTVLSSLSNNSPNFNQTRSILLSLFTPIGRCRFLDEKHFDACTAVSGSGPAFALVILEAIADGGVMMGLPRSEALELAAQTMQGAARMVLQTGSHPAALKDSVTTPAGCTIAGLLALEDGRVRSTIARAIQTATLHAAGLGNTSQTSSPKN